jgi:hypothetical protein
MHFISIRNLALALSTRWMHASVVLIAFTLAAGCASKPVVHPATSHAVSDPRQIKILKKEPKEYEQLQTIRMVLAPEDRWDKQGNANPGFDKLLHKAAAVGANGLLLKSDETNGLALAGYHGEFYQVPILRTTTDHTVIVQAVYIVKE